MYFTEERILEEHFETCQKVWTSDLVCDKSKQFKSNVPSEKKIMVRDRFLKTVKGLGAVSQCFAGIHDHGLKTDYVSPI